MKKTVVIVGGGIAGLTAALALRKEFQVVVVDRDAECGGLLKSRKSPDGTPFDFGTHVIGETGVPEADRLVFDRLRGPGWNQFRVIKTGSYFNGRLQERSAHVDIRSLPKDEYDRATKELLACPDVSPAECDDLETFLLRQFGPTITDRVQRPALRKLFACDLKELLPDNPFALKRLIAFEPERSRELKRDPVLDRKLAFNSYDEGIGPLTYFYPKNGGIGQWVEDICAELTAGGVRFHNGRSVAKTALEGGRLRSLTLDDGSVLPCSSLIWTAAPFFLLKSLGLESRGTPLKPRPTGLFYFTFDRPFRTDAHYVTCYDEALKTFRVTMFPNLRARAGDRSFNCTVEAIGDGASAEHLPTILTELASMGLVDPAAKPLYSAFELLAAGFPAVTRDFAAAARRQADAAREASPDILLLGRAKHDAFSTTSVIVEALEASKRLLAAERA